MTTPKEALERARNAVNAIVLSTHSVSFTADLKVIDEALASLQGEDAVERVALAWAKARNEWMRASRHGTQEEADKAAVAAILATGLVPDAAAIRADEREKCAKVAESKYQDRNWHTAYQIARDTIAAAIRSGGGE